MPTPVVAGCGAAARNRISASGLDLTFTMESASGTAGRRFKNVPHALGERP